MGMQMSMRGSAGKGIPTQSFLFTLKAKLSTDHGGVGHSLSGKVWEEPLHQCARDRAADKWYKDRWNSLVCSVQVLNYWVQWYSLRPTEKVWETLFPSPGDMTIRVWVTPCACSWPTTYHMFPTLSDSSRQKTLFISPVNLSAYHRVCPEYTQYILLNEEGMSECWNHLSWGQELGWKTVSQRPKS